MGYCAICGNMGIKLDGTPCECKISEETIFSDVVCLDIPEQYQGVVFNQSLVPSDCGEAYQNFMQTVFDQITTFRLRNKNMVICSPAGHSKTILAYSVIQSLFRKRMPTCALYDVLEIKRISSDIDLGRKDADEMIYKAPYLFTKIPIDTSFATYATIAMLIDRRVRRGHSTIFLYNGSWEQLIYGDNRGVMTSLLGDGAYGTLENKTWRIVK